MALRRSGTRLVLLSMSMLLPIEGCATMRGAVDGATTLATSDATWAVKENAPLTVVVHRAQAAEATAAEVERLLTATAADTQSAWPAALALAPVFTTSTLQSFKLHPHYEGKTFQVVHALVWADALAQVRAGGGESRSLLTAVSPELSTGYETISVQLDSIKQMDAEHDQIEEAIKRSDIAESERQMLTTKSQVLAVKTSEASDAIAPMREAYAAACAAAAAKVSPALQVQYGVALVNLRQAVSDATTANQAAFLGYPMAIARFVTGGVGELKDDLIEATKAIASDYVYERTGKRVSMAPFNYSVGYENGRVTLSINGLTPADIGSVTLTDLTTETLRRAQKFATDAVALVVVTNDTRKRLEFEASVLDGILAGFEQSGYKRPLAALQTAGGSGAGSKWRNVLSNLSGGQPVAKAANQAPTTLSQVTSGGHSDAVVIPGRPSDTLPSLRFQELGTANPAVSLSGGGLKAPTLATP